MSATYWPYMTQAPYHNDIDITRAWPDGLPPGFEFGASTSAFQIEGATGADGRGPSIWDAFCAQDGTIAGAATADVACDHYHRWEEDLDLLAQLGVGAYRFSVAWSRVLPTGAGAPNEAGLAFYERLVDGLLARDISPVVCLFHWDLPEALQQSGGWSERDTSLRFAEYAGLMGDRLGDRVERWVTLNEPFVHLSRGHLIGDHAPGMRVRDWGTLAHGMLLAHAWAAEALRGAGVRGGVGIIESLAPVRPGSADPADQFVAQIFDAMRNQLFLAPIMQGAYPDAILPAAPSLATAVQPGDMDAIAAPLDFLGVNYYQPVGIRAAAPGGPLPFRFVRVEGLEETDAGMMIDPDGLRESLVTLAQRHGEHLPPIYVTEIGCAYADADAHDPQRIAYLEAHLAAIAAAIDEGVDVRGCYIWSLLDNFEWEQGYDARYGLVQVDFETAKRTPKSSFEWLAGILAARPSAGAQAGDPV